MAARSTDAYIVGLNEVLRGLRNFPKEAAADLRTASGRIAERHMAPAWRAAALNGAGPWGPTVAASVRVRRDRLPSVNIGSQRKKLRGGASPTMVRYPSDKGQSGRGGQHVPTAFGEGGDWIGQAKGYVPAALREWGQALDAVVNKWSVM